MILPILLGFLGALLTCQAGPIVETNYGKVEGFEYENAEVFLAIPFAKPPVDELRFERPVSPEPWQDVYQATQFRNDCTPHYRLVAQFSSYSGEDCLTLNIISPKQKKSDDPLPVLFWVHGGGYEIGSGSQHGYEFFAKEYAPRGVIVVTIQYRLGFMGFFTDGQDGNYGLFDQAAALRFVKDNIEYFGGDSNKITIWGYSAGAASVSQLTLSPYSRDLYNQAIIMSASSFSGWATGSKVAEHSKQLAEILGCPWPNAKECMKKKPLSEIFDAVEVQGYTTGTIDILRWSPIIDGDYLPENPEKLLRKVADVSKPVLMGLSNKEGSYFAAANMGRVIADFGLSETELPKVDADFISEVVGRKLLYENRYGENRNKVWDDIMDFYTGDDQKEEKTNGFYVNQYSEILSDITFNVPIVREIMSRVEQKTKIWTYLFEHYNEHIWKKYIPEEARGSPHANEYHYLFDMPVMAKIDFSKEPEKSIRSDLIDMVVSFAKTGVPNIQNIEWRPVSDPDDINFLNIKTDSVKIEHGLFQEPLHFWNSLRDREHFDLIDPTSTASTSQKDEL